MLYKLYFIFFQFSMEVNLVFQVSKYSHWIEIGVFFFNHKKILKQMLRKIVFYLNVI